MHPITIYITLTPELAKRSEEQKCKAIYQILKKLQKLGIHISEPEPYEEFAQICVAVFKKNKFDILYGPVDRSPNELGNE